LQSSHDCAGQGPKKLGGLPAANAPNLGT
jgi:hypothetical protein